MNQVFCVCVIFTILSPNMQQINTLIRSVYWLRFIEWKPSTTDPIFTALLKICPYCPGFRCSLLGI